MPKRERQANQESFASYLLVELSPPSRSATTPVATDEHKPSNNRPVTISAKLDRQPYGGRP